MASRVLVSDVAAFWAEVELEYRRQEEQERERLAALSEEQRMQAQSQQRAAGYRLYGDDPIAWAYDMIEWPEGQKLAPYQEDILSHLPIKKRVAFRGPHGSGKSTTMAIAILWFALTRDGDDWKIPTTASAWRQLTKFLWPEIRKWSRRLRWDRLGRDPFDRRTELLMYSLKLRTGEAFAMASDVPENMEGAHADRLLGIFDESKTIPDPTFDALEGALSGPGEALALAGSTPGEPVGRFYEIHRRAPGTEDWHVRHITMEEAIAAGRMSKEWAEQRARQWGTGSAVYQNRVLGEFAASDEDSVIPLSWVEAAQDRWREIMDDPEYDWPAFTAVGVDVGQGSERSDKTTMALRQGHIISEIRRFQRADTMETAGRVKGILQAYGGRAMIDAIGIGAGTLHRLREEKVKHVYAFLAGASPKQRTPSGLLVDWKDRSGELGASDTRSAAWWRLRELLDPTYAEDIALPPDDTLTGDLTAPKYRVMGQGKIKIESKDELRKAERLGRSTDCLVAGTRILTPTGERCIEAIAIGDTVSTPWGDQPVIATHCVQSRQLVTVTLVDGRSITGKPDHAVFTFGRGWVKLVDVCDGDTVSLASWSTRTLWMLLGKLNTEAEHTGFKRVVKNAGITLPMARGKVNRPVRRSIGISTVTRMGRFLTDTMSITGITTASTMIRQTLWQSQRANISENICRNDIEIRHTEPGILSIWRQSETRRRRGIGRKQGAHGIANTRSNRSPLVMHGANSVDDPIWPHRGTRDTVPETASQMPIMRVADMSRWKNVARLVVWCLSRIDTNRGGHVRTVVQHFSGNPRNVYDLTLARHNAYWANGMLVENCGDSVIQAFWEPTDTETAIPLPAGIERSEPGWPR